MAKLKDEMISKGKERYIESIRALGGAREYYKCGALGGMDVALSLSESDWADRWEKAMA